MDESILPDRDDIPIATVRHLDSELVTIGDNLAIQIQTFVAAGKPRMVLKVIKAGEIASAIEIMDARNAYKLGKAISGQAELMVLDKVAPLA